MAFLRNDSKCEPLIHNKVSAGEEAVMVGSAAALGAGDVITCQYREHGVFLQRGFELKDFMSQLTANCNDPGKGRNMPVHYSGKDKVGIVSCSFMDQSIDLVLTD